MNLHSPITAVATFLVCALLAGAIWNFMVKPQDEKITEKETTLEQKKLQLQQYKDAAAQLPSLREEVAKLEVERQEFLDALPKAAQFGKVVQDLKTTIQTSNTQMRSVDFSAGSNQDLPAGVRPMAINLSLGGKFGEIFQALQRLETQGRFTNVNSLNLQMPTATEQDPVLESGLVLTVYTYDAEKDTTAPTSSSEGTDGNAPAPAPAPAAGGAP